MSADPWCYLEAPDLTRLDLASVLVHEVLGVPYLVGSCLTGPDYRDVDVRVILRDERYDQLFARRPADRHYVSATALRIDFQIQRMTDANQRYGAGTTGTVRHPLGLYPSAATGRESSPGGRDLPAVGRDSRFRADDFSTTARGPESAFPQVRADSKVQES